MSDTLFVGKSEAIGNLHLNTHFQKAMLFHPALMDLFKKRISDVVFSDINTLRKNGLHDNKAIIMEESIAQAKKDLISELE